MVSKYKTLNQAHRKALTENQELAAELERLRAGNTGGNLQSRATSPPPL